MDELSLDNTWIEDFEKNDKYYKSFYLEDITCIPIRCIFLNENEIINVKKEKLFLYWQIFVCGLHPTSMCALLLKIPVLLPCCGQFIFY